MGYLSSDRKPENLRMLPQRGTSNTKIDAARPALLPGKRISKTGHIYWECRRNRTDLLYKDV